MNVTPVPASPSLAQTTAPARKNKRQPWLATISGVCFVFGALLAMQIRSFQSVQLGYEQKKQNEVQATKLVEQARAEAAKEAKQREELNRKLIALQTAMAQKTNLSASQLTALNSQIKDLQTVAGLTTVSGQGVSITLSDDPQAAQYGGDPSQPLPGIVHDYDLLQVVNELRLTKADAIAVRGAGGDAIRLTGYTPIRCVGSTILVNWEPVAAPFTIEAIGNIKSLKSALEMPNGIVDVLRKSGAIGVKISESNNLTMPPANGGAPKLKVAKSA